MYLLEMESKLLPGKYVNVIEAGDRNDGYKIR